MPKLKHTPRPAESDGRTGLNIDRYFTTDGTDPFDTVEWERRTAEIRDEHEQVIFRLEECEVPRPWSQLATNVVASRYLSGDTGPNGRETSVRQLIHRVTRTITDWGRADGVFATPEDAERFYDELTWLCLHQYGAFNSPVWFNVGLAQQYGLEAECCQYHWDKEAETVRETRAAYEHPQASACFILSVADNMQSIMGLAATEAMVFKYGSGAGTDLSALRARGERLSGGGEASGPVSFMRVYDQVAAVVRSGGKKRRAAKMQSLRSDHPDIVQFIQCKAKEERKAKVLIDNGYEADFNGEAYGSVLFQNSNLSVRLSDEFMRAVEHDAEWTTRWVKSGETAATYKARDLLRLMAEAAWQSGDPGVQYDDTINRWHTCPNSGRINASNPCSEFMFLDDTACNLASLNLLRFRRADGSFEVEAFRHAVDLFFIAQEILVDNASYPAAEVARKSHLFRPLGLGYANLGALLMSLGLPYDSDAARDYAAGITALMTGQAYLTSARLAASVGPFPGFAENREPMLRVMEQHAAAAAEPARLEDSPRGLGKPAGESASPPSIGPACPGDLRTAAHDVWAECLDAGRAHGYRNAQATVLAPTGTIAFLMDCDTTGVEPDIALVKYKRLAGRGLLKIVNRSVELALERLGYDDESRTRIVRHIGDHETIEGAPDLKPEHLPVFDCAFRAAQGTRALNPAAHLHMLAAVQPFLSGAISKTINLPHDATPERIAEVYQEGWRLGLKAVAIYRDGSKLSQPVSTSQATTRRGKVAKRRLPDTRQSITHKFDIAGHKGYVTVGLYEDGTPGEVFIIMAKEGSTIGGLMDAFGTAISVGLQYGVPLEDLVNKFVHARFEPAGFTGNPEIPIAKSIVDYIFRWLGNRFVAGFRQSQSVSRNPLDNGNPSHLPAAAIPTLDGSARLATPLDERMAQVAQFQTDAPACDFCGALTVRTGSCYRCLNCGNSLGCS